MSNLETKFNHVGLALTELLLPNDSIDSKKWAVVACDQFSSEPEYWEAVKKEINNSASCLELIFPECYLEKDESTRIKSIQSTMHEYLQSETFKTLQNSIILVERTFSNGKVRYGIVTAVDLENYDFSPNSKSLVRATEGTLIERIIPRKKIRSGAEIELSHIMVLINDANKTVIEPIVENKAKLKKLYDFELMTNAGRLTGYQVNSEKLLTEFTEALSFLKNEGRELALKDVLLYAMGDGNHSLATAKTIWQELKKENPSVIESKHPARYALIELNNIYDGGISFESIHRLLLNSNIKVIDQFILESNSKKISANIDDLKKIANNENGKFNDEIGIMTNNIVFKIKLNSEGAIASTKLVQDFLSKHIEAENLVVDYIHGIDSLSRLAINNNIGIILPTMNKSELFPSVIKNGPLPRKTFSMGEALEKRFYYEARKIKIS